MGNHMDLSKELRPFADLMRQRRKELKLNAHDLSALAGYGITWCTELETGKGTINPSLRRLIYWAQALDAQELGVYVVFDGHYHAFPVFEIDDEDLKDDDDSA